MSDVFADAASLKRRRELMAQMLQQSQASPIVGNTGLGQALAKLGTAWIVGDANRELDQAEAANRQQYSKELAGEFDRFIKRYQGASGEVLDNERARELMESGVNPQLAESTPADPRGAIFQAMASRFPELQVAGRAGIPTVLERGTKPSTIKEVNGKLVDVSDPAAPRVIGDYSKPEDEFEEVQRLDAAGKLVPALRNKKTGKIEFLDKSPRTSVSVGVNLPAAEKEFDKAFGKEEGQRLSAGLGSRGAQIDSIGEVQAARQLLNQGIHTGLLANVKLLGEKALAELYVVDPVKAARTEEFQAHLGNVVLPRLKDIGGNDTKEEREYIEKVVGGKISFEAPAIARILESAEKKLRKKVAQTDSEAARWRAAGKSGVPTIEDLPTVPGELRSQPAVSGLSPAEQAELEALRRRFGR